MRMGHPLNDLQVAILRWIADGCPAGQITGTSYKRTAAALQDRRLVKIDRRGGGWAATATERGLHYLEHGTFPADAASSARSLRGRPAASGDATVTSSHQAGGRSTIPSSSFVARVTPVARHPRVPPTEALVAEVVAAGGRLEFNEEDRVQPIYKLSELVRHVNRFNKAPDGQRLQLDRLRLPGADWRTPARYVLYFEKGPENQQVPPQPVPVPEDVRRYHPAVRQLRKSEKSSSSAVTARRWRVLHAIAAEAERRGYKVAAYVHRSAHDLRRKPESWDLLLTVDGETVPLELTQENDRVEHVPTARELAEKQRYSWTRIPTHDSIPSGRLRLEVGGPNYAERQSFWADRTRWTLEEKLPEALREVAVRIEELRAKREARTQAEAAYRNAVEQEQVRARDRAAAAHRKELLDQQLQRWREVRELRAFAAELTTRIEAAVSSPPVDDTAIAGARRWQSWIEEQATRLDPLTDLPGWPAAPELPLYELEKFMRRVPEPIEMSYRPRRYD